MNIPLFGFVDFRQGDAREMGATHNVLRLTV